jgi:mitochondrial fission protein ELM1
MAEPNPHMGHLAWGDAFIITADSVSMLSEACSTGYLHLHPLVFTLLYVPITVCSYILKSLSCRKPVYVIGTEHCRWKFIDFHKNLREKGVARPFTGLEDVRSSISLTLLFHF